MKAPHLFLLDALMLEDEPALEAWRAWRAIANMDRLDAASFRLLPALAARLEPWLAGDPQRAILTGICRRGWSQAQMRRKVLAEAVSVLAGADVPAQAAGPVDWADRYWPAGVMRSIESLNLDVVPADVNRAVETLMQAGWTVEGRSPAGSWFELRFAPPVRLRNRAGVGVRVHWRGLPNSDVVLPELAGWKARETSAEHDLVRVLGCEYADGLHWSCDAAMIGRVSIDWDEVARLLRWHYLAKTRLHEWNPALVRSIPLGIGERVLTWPLRMYRRIRVAGRH
ncbi:hypothetical protein [Paludibaculum fermentans]|uniref:Uncharacterized protein n=1 Tax=Paludibaculum fermentans TaxID=1473598 RepID=A0A7S7NPY2_PALFE|nr:hypothetical protein [Paludibaculum fermentans]QOY87559.1 hypothetical protein IRI77_33200 [Paludibaculum fermentans]